MKRRELLIGVPLFLVGMYTPILLKGCTDKKKTAPVTIEQLRVQRRLQPLLAYEQLTSSSADGAVSEAKHILEDGWRRENYPLIAITPPIPWDETYETSRSWSFHLHSWELLDPLLTAYSQTGEKQYLRASLSVALDWISNYPTRKTDSIMAWYDMAVGLRAYRLAYVLDACCRLQEVKDETIAQLWQSTLLHAEALQDEEEFASHSNHGFYQVAGQLALVRRISELPNTKQMQRQANQRFEFMLEEQFSPAGVHLEHSPDYHRMVFDTFNGILEADLTKQKRIWELRDRVEASLAWFVMPNGFLANFGDTDRRKMFKDNLDESEYQVEAMKFVKSRGVKGEPPQETMRAFEDAGYFIARDRWSNGTKDFEQCSYLAQICGFHSRTHKHADDLSFIWYDRAQEILVDAGRYGYLGRTETGSPLWEDGFWYSDPNRIYVESTHAHNTVQIDGRNHQRRGRNPYGSALKRWGKQDNIIFAESHVRHFRTLRHARVLLFHPGEWLLVYDWLWDNLKENHHFTQWFHFAPHLEVAVEKEQLNVTNAKIPLKAVSLLPGLELGNPIRGQKEPHLQGWYSPQEKQMIPNWAVAWEKQNVPAATFATLFAFRSKLEPDWDYSEANTSGRRARFRWYDEQGRNTLILERPANGDITLNWTT